MKIRQIILAFVTSIALCGSLISTPAVAADKSFSALDGIEVQALTAAEMDAIHGEGHRLAAAIERLKTRSAAIVDRLRARGKTRLADRLDGIFGRIIARLEAIQVKVAARTGH